MPPQRETSRLLLRPFTLDDVDAAYRVLEGHPNVWKFDPGFQRTCEQRAAIIRRYSETNEPDGCGTLAVVAQDRQQVIGYVGLQLYILPRAPFATPEVELYYKFGRDYWGHGYATEACQALIGFAFAELRLARLVTITQPSNTPSLRLLARLGMCIEAAPARWKDTVMATLDNEQRPSRVA